MKSKAAAAGVIYAVLFNNGYMKAGVARRNAAGRIRQHMTKAAIVGASKISEIAVQVPFAHLVCEAELLRICESRFSRLPSFGREWFTGVSLGPFTELEGVMQRIASQSAGLEHSCPTERQDNSNRMYNSLVPRSKPEVVDIKYIEALGIAKSMQAMISNDLISGPMFSPSESFRGLSYFTVTMSLYLYAMPDEERGECVRAVSEGLSDADLGEIFAMLSAAEAVARNAAAHFNADQPKHHH